MPTINEYTANANAGIRVDCKCEKCSTLFSYVHFICITHTDSFQSMGKDSIGFFDRVFFPKFKKKLDEKVSKKREKKLKKKKYGFFKCPTCGYTQSWMVQQVKKTNALGFFIMVSFISLIVLNIFFTPFLKSLTGEDFSSFVTALIISIGIGLITYLFVWQIYQPNKGVTDFPKQYPIVTPLSIYYQYSRNTLGAIGASIPGFNAIQQKVGYGVIFDYLVAEKVPSKAIKNSQWICPVCGTSINESENICSSCKFSYITNFSTAGSAS